jgi:hypothetical protein
MAETPLNVEPRPLETEVLKREFIAGGTSSPAMVSIRRALPTYVDDITRDFGGEIYERMITDPVVASAVDSIQLAVLSEGVTFIPAYATPNGFAAPEPAQVAEADRAREVCDFVKRAFDGSESSVASELLDCLIYGYKVAEITLQKGRGEDSGRLILKSCKGKHFKLINFVVDENFNVDGILAAMPGTPVNVSAIGTVDPETAKNFLPRWKFALAQHRPNNGDPRGTSILRPAYNAWFIKSQILPDYYKYLRQFATPSIVGKTPESDAQGFVNKTNADGTVATNVDGTPIFITAEMALYRALEVFVGGSILAVKGGTEIDLIHSEGGGEAFTNAYDYFDKQIVTAIMGTSRASMEGKGGDKGGSSVAQDITQLRIAYLKELISSVIYRDIVRLLVSVNFGEDALRYAPVVALKQVEQQDWARELDAISRAMQSGVIMTAHLPAIWARFGFEADAEAVRMEVEDRNRQAAMNADNMAKVLDPAAVAGD